MHAHRTTTNLVHVNLKTLPRFLSQGLGTMYPLSPSRRPCWVPPHTLGYLKTKPQERSKVFYVFGVFLHCTESVSDN